MSLEPPDDLADWEDEDNSEGSFVIVFLDCKECGQPIGCMDGNKPPKSCKEHSSFN